MFGRRRQTPTYINKSTSCIKQDFENYQVSAEWFREVLDLDEDTYYFVVFPYF